MVKIHLGVDTRAALPGAVKGVLRLPPSVRGHGKAFAQNPSQKLFASTELGIKHPRSSRRRSSRNRIKVSAKLLECNINAFHSRPYKRRKRKRSSIADSEVHCGNYLNGNS